MINFIYVLLFIFQLVFNISYAADCIKITKDAEIFNNRREITTFYYRSAVGKRGEKTCLQDEIPFSIKFITKGEIEVEVRKGFLKPFMIHKLNTGCYPVGRKSTKKTMALAKERNALHLMTMKPGGKEKYYLSIGKSSLTAVLAKCKAKAGGG